MDIIFTVLKIMGCLLLLALAFGIWFVIAADKNTKEFGVRRDLALSKIKKFKPTEFYNDLAFDEENGALAFIVEEDDDVKILMIDPKSIIASECIVNGDSYSVTKNSKSTLLRAAAGGLILGPVGAVVGAISAQGDSKTTTTGAKEYKLIISLDRLDVKLKVVQFFDQEKMMLWNSYVNIAMRRDRVIEQPTACIEERSDDSLSNDMSLREKLENLETLRSNGFITDEEYELKKTSVHLSV